MLLIAVVGFQLFCKYLSYLTACPFQLKITIVLCKIVFLPDDAILVQYMLLLCVLSVCMSVHLLQLTSRKFY